MVKIKPPKVVEQPITMLTQDDLRALLKVWSGGAVEDRRDTAIIFVLFNAGMPRSEVAGLQVADIDTTLSVLRVAGKGGRGGAYPYGTRTGLALDRSLRLRASGAWPDRSYGSHAWHRVPATAFIRCCRFKPANFGEFASGDTIP